MNENINIVENLTRDNVKTHPLTLEAKEKFINDLKSRAGKREIYLDVLDEDIDKYKSDYYTENFHKKVLDAYEFKDTDKIFILPNATLIEKSKFNKLIRDKLIKGKRTYNIDEATVIVTDKHKGIFTINLYKILSLVSTTTPYVHLTLSRTWNMFHDILRYFPEDFITTGHPTGKYDLTKTTYMWNPETAMKKLVPEEELNAYLSKMYVGNVANITKSYVDIEFDWYHKLVDPKYTLVDEKVVLSVTLDELNKTRESTEEYSFEAVEALFRSGDAENIKLGFTILENVNVTPELFRLSGIFFSLSHTYSPSSYRNVFFEKIVKRNPTLNSIIYYNNQTKNVYCMAGVMELATTLMHKFKEIKVTSADVENLLKYVSGAKNITKYPNISEINFTLSVLKFLGHPITRQELIEKLYTKDGLLSMDSDFIKLITNETVS